MVRDSHNRFPAQDATLITRVKSMYRSPAATIRSATQLWKDDLLHRTHRIAPSQTPGILTCEVDATVCSEAGLRGYDMLKRNGTRNESRIKAYEGSPEENGELRRSFWSSWVLFNIPNRYSFLFLGGYVPHALADSDMSRHQHRVGPHRHLQPLSSLRISIFTHVVYPPQRVGPGLRAYNVKISWMIKRAANGFLSMARSPSKALDLLHSQRKPP